MRRLLELPGRRHREREPVARQPLHRVYPALSHEAPAHSCTSIRRTSAASRSATRSTLFKPSARSELIHLAARVACRTQSKDFKTPPATMLNELLPAGVSTLVSVGPTPSTPAQRPDWTHPSEHLEGLAIRSSLRSSRTHRFDTTGTTPATSPRSGWTSRSVPCALMVRARAPFSADTYGGGNDPKRDRRRSRFLAVHVTHHRPLSAMLWSSGDPSTRSSSYPSPSIR